MAYRFERRKFGLVPNAVQIAELAIEKQAQTLLMPVSARRQLNDLPDDLWRKISIEFYKDPADARCCRQDETHEFASA